MTQTPFSHLATTHISTEDMYAIAQSSQIEVLEQEVPLLIQHMQDVLTYAARVTTIAADIQKPLTYNLKNHNVFRNDTTVPCNAELLLQRAPEREGSFFVVPMILEHS